MNTKRKNRIIRISFLLNGFLFLMGGVNLMGEQKILFGLIQIIAAILNFGMLTNIKSETNKYHLSISIFIVNIFVAISIAVNYIQSGTQYIQYVWFLVAFLTLGATIIQIRKHKTPSK